MLASTIMHGGLHFDLGSDGTVTITREATAQTIQLSPSEMRYLQAILTIHGWPVVSLNVGDRDDY